MEKCDRCERGEDKVKLIDAIQRNEVIKLCEECAVFETMPIIRKPNASQLDFSHKPYSVRERLSKMAGIENKEKKEQENISKIAREVFTRKIDKEKERNFEASIRAARNRNKPLNLVENYNWKILMGRKQRKITRSQLAKAIGESEESVRLIETKEFPDDALRIIEKVEQYFGIKLRKEQENQTREVQVPARVLKFERNGINSITIADLQRMKQEKEKLANKQINEGKKVEENSKKEIQGGKKGWFSSIFSKLKKKEKEKSIEEDIKERKSIDNSLLGKDIEFLE